MEEKSELTPTKEELTLIQTLKNELQDYLADTISLTGSAREVLCEIISDSNTLLKYIRGRKQNLLKARNSIIRYAEIKCDIYPELFPEKVPWFVRHVFDNQILTVLKNRDSLGTIIVTFSTDKWDETVVSLEEILCAGRYLIDALMDFPDLFSKGIIVVTDARGATMSKARYYTVPIILKFFNVFWQAYPIPMKGVYFANSPFFVKPIYSCLKPFLPKKLKERLLISSGLNELHTRLSKEILPESLGGTLPQDEASSLSFLQLYD